ncbi:MAG: hypothetical protein OEV74_20710 [Cyclobacteriaceae bacterium]|nr:hypothetical protein [Cyclobacteriaceae bacterium]MDH4298706.1 hypothetical protein [Cyclobacteriaceae bacterium]MDH5247917.1 hypothetical protein [Cyclobacteriaceae bacterium]
MLDNEIAHAILHWRAPSCLGVALSAILLVQPQTPALLRGAAAIAHAVRTHIRYPVDYVFWFQFDRNQLVVDLNAS